MVSIIRVAAAVNKVSPGNPSACLKELTGTLDLLRESPADIVIFPQLALAPPDCGSLLAGSWIADACSTALGELCLATSDLDCYLIVGLPVGGCGHNLSACAVLHRTASRWVPTANHREIKNAPSFGWRKKFPHRFLLHLRYRG